MKPILLAFLLVLSGLSSSFSQSVLKEAPPAAAGMSATRLARIDSLLKEYIDKQWIAGGTAIIARDGKIVYHKSLGYDDLESRSVLKKDAIFRIASQTKAITSVGVMMLYEEGKFLLDDPISRYIPEFRSPKVIEKFSAADTTFTTIPAKREVTIRDLLTHTSGIGYAQIGTPQMNAIYAKAGVVGGIGVDRIVLGDKMKILAALPLMHHPGEQWTYGLNTDVLGYLIEVVSGQSLDAFFQKRIFGPLGMKDSYFYLPASKRARLVKLTTEDNGRAVKAPQTLHINGTFYSDYPAGDGTYYSGGGGLSSTALDYAIFMQMLLNAGEYGGKRLLSKASVRMMTSNQIGTMNMWSGNKFGLGFEFVTENNAGKSPLSVGSYFWGGMFSSTYWIDPKEKIVAQLFLNQYPNSHRDVHEKFKVLVYSAMD